MKWGRCNGERTFKFNSRLYQSIKARYSKLRSWMMRMSSHNPSMGTIWIHSDKLMESKKWKKDLPVPNGWITGRVINWESHFNKQKEKIRKKIIRKERERKLEKRMA